MPTEPEVGIPLAVEGCEVRPDPVAVPELVATGVALAVAVGDGVGLGVVALLVPVPPMGTGLPDPKGCAC